MIKINKWYESAIACSFYLALAVLGFINLPKTYAIYDECSMLDDVRINYHIAYYLTKWYWVWCIIVMAVSLAIVVKTKFVSEKSNGIINVSACMIVICIGVLVAVIVFGPFVGGIMMPIEK